MDRNIEQMKNATDWIVWTLLLWCVVVAIACATETKVRPVDSAKRFSRKRRK